jgi:type IV pilus assembly protein PilW
MHIPAYALRQSGLSLVELMVGMMVGLIGIVIISHLYVTNEQYKRSTTGSGAAQVNGAVALYTIERDLRMAGYGINHSQALGCASAACTLPTCSPLQYFYNNTYSAFPGAPAAAPGAEVAPRTIAPVVIIKTPDLTDSLTILYSGDNERASPNTLTQTMSPPYDYNTDGTAGFETGNIVVATQGTNCVLSQVTVKQEISQLTRPAGAYNPGGNGSFSNLFSKGAFIFNLGTTPVWRNYAIANNKLQVTDVLPPKGGKGGQDLVDDIVDMQALYGKDTNGDGDVDTYDDVTPVNAADWQQVLAVRIAVLARSQNYEKPDPALGCQATTKLNQPTWGPRDAAAKVFPKLDADLGTSEAGCYKYRVFETVVPLRNMIWRSS